MKLPQKQGFDALVEITREMKRAKLSRRTMLAAGGFAALIASPSFEVLEIPPTAPSSEVAASLSYRVGQTPRPSEPLQQTDCSAS